MTYISGFVLAAPRADKDGFVACAGRTGPIVTDERMYREGHPVSLDGKWMIFGNFLPVVELIS